MVNAFSFWESVNFVIITLAENGQPPLEVLYCEPQVGFPGQEHFTNAAACHCSDVCFTAPTRPNTRGEACTSVPDNPRLCLMGLFP